MARKIISLKPIRNQTVRCGWVWRAHVTVMNEDNTEVAETYDYEIEAPNSGSIEDKISCSEEAGENDTLEFIFEPCYTYEAKVVEILSTNIDFEHKKISVKYLANIISYEDEREFSKTVVVEGIERECEFSSDVLFTWEYDMMEYERVYDTLKDCLLDCIEGSEDFDTLNRVDVSQKYGFVDDVII